MEERILKEIKGIIVGQSEINNKLTDRIIQLEKEIKVLREQREDFYGHKK